MVPQWIISRVISPRKRFALPFSNLQLRLEGT
jgi:hypothetical protein